MQHLPNSRSDDQNVSASNENFNVSSDEEDGGLRLINDDECVDVIVDKPSRKSKL